MHIKMMSNISMLNITSTNETKQGSETDLSYEIFWLFIVPCLCLFGTITNLISVLTLARLKKKNHVYKFMLASSFANFLYMFLCGFIFLLKCNRLCSINQNTLAIVLYSYLIWDYFTSSLAILISLIEIVMCLQRFSIISNSKRFKFENFRVIFPIIVVFSLLNYLPRLFFKEINALSDGYALVNTKLSKQMFGIILDLLMSAVRGPILLCLIFIINVLTAIQFASLMKKKKKLNERNKQKGKIIKML